MSASDGKVPVIGGVKAAYGFLGAHWRTAMVAALPMAVTGALMQQSSVLTLLGQGWGGYFLWLLASFAAGMAFQAAMLRAAVRGEGGGAIPLRWGMDEWRLLGATLVFLFFLIVVLMIPSIMLMMFIGILTGASGVSIETLENNPEAAAQALGGVGGLFILVATIAIMAAFLYIVLRLIVFSAATIGERRLMLFSTWGWTQGNVLRILAAVLLCALPLIPIAIVLLVVLNAAFGYDFIAFATATEASQINTNTMWLAGALAALCSPASTHFSTRA